MLWTFVANAPARRFYAREGFVEVRRTGGENEEGLPDVLLKWRAGVTGGERTWLPVLAVVAGIVVLWYVLAVVLNAAWAHDQAGRDGVTLGPAVLVAATLAPGAAAAAGAAPGGWRSSGRRRSRWRRRSKRSLVYHGWITLSATLAGFVLGAGLGILLAIGIVHDRTMDASVMPWVIASQTIPILAIAPMIIVVLNSVGVTGLLPKAIISMYLSFFPVVVGMVKGLRSPERDAARPDAHLERQPRRRRFRKLRWPAALPYLFASLKVAAAASLVGAIIGELPTGAVAGLGARMLSGSYYGQTVQIWSALLMAAILAAALVGLIGLAERLTARAMGARP